MLLNLINSKALPISSEHSLKVLMRDDGAAAERFFEDPQVYLTRWMHGKVKDWPQGFYGAMGDAPLTRLHSALINSRALATKFQLGFSRRSTKAALSLRI